MPSEAEARGHPHSNPHCGRSDELRNRVDTVHSPSNPNPRESAASHRHAGSTGAGHAAPSDGGRRVPGVSAEAVLACMRRACAGMSDAVQYQQLWSMLRKSKELWVAVRDALLFNLIWMAVSFCKSCLVLKWVHRLVGEEGIRAMEFLFLLTWNIPVYVLLICLSLFWHNTIVQEACLLTNRRPFRQLDPMQMLLESSAKITDEIYRMLVVVIFYFFAKLIQLVLSHAGLAFAGKAIYCVASSWMAAFYAMEYVWTTLGWNLKERIAFFERRWSYLGGFGLPITLATYGESSAPSNLTRGLVFHCVGGYLWPPRPSRVLELATRLLPCCVQIEAS